jgi:leukotriene-A4 hydrolase
MSQGDPHSFADFNQGRIQHIDFDLRLDFERQSLTGQAAYRLASPASGSLFLDTRQLQIESITADGKPLQWELDRQDDILGSRLHLSGLNHLSQFRIAFITSPTASALQWLKPEATAGGHYPFLFSQCQAIHARSIFPCQDSPSVRFTHSAVIELPAPMVAVMASAPLGRRREGGLMRCEFEMPQAVPSYLFGLAAGEIEARDLGPRCRIYAEPAMLEAAAWEFADTQSMLEAAEQLFGPYAWERYDMLLMPPSFPYGGMENPRLTFLTPTLIAGDRSQTHVVAHELAHSWTGNLITNATWEDFWLNEGWTTYAERRILEALYGSEFASLAAAVGRRNMHTVMARYGLDSDPTRLKFNQQGLDPDRVTSQIAYEKGYALLVSIERAVGRQRFDGFIRKYIASFPFHSLSTEDFVAFLTAELPEAGRQVDLHSWLYDAGFPENAPESHSVYQDQVTAAINRCLEGQLPTPDEVADWIPAQIELFLKSLDGRLSAGECAQLETLFELGASRNDQLLAAFYVLAIHSGYEAVLPGVEKLLARVGRGLYIGPIYLGLAETEWSRDKARAIYRRNQARYHPIAQNLIEHYLDRCGV